MHCALLRICARLSWDSITQDSGSFRASNAMAYEYDDAISIIKEMYEMQCGSRVSESQTTTALQKLVKQNPEKPHHAICV